MSEVNAQDRVAELELQLEESNKNLAASEARNADLEAEVKKLQDKNAKFENPSFKLGEDEYEILVKHARVPGVGPVSAADIAADPELQASLVAKQSGIIRKKA